MANFSHFSVRIPPAVARYAEDRERPSDEMPLETFESLDPPLLQGKEKESNRRC